MKWKSRAGRFGKNSSIACNIARYANPRNKLRKFNDHNRPAVVAARCGFCRRPRRVEIGGDPTLFFVEFRIMASITGGANAMTKIRLAVSADVLFDRNPPLLFGPDLLAVHTDGQESTQRLDLFERGMQGLVRVFQTLHCLPPVLLNRGNEDGHTAEHNRSCYSAHAKIQHIWRTVKEQIKKENRNERDNETCRSACVSGNNNDCSHKEQIAAMHYKSRKRKRQQSGGNEAGNYDDRDTLARHRDTPFNACLLISAIESFCVSASSPSEERASRNGPIITICPQGISDASHSWRKNRPSTHRPPGSGGSGVPNLGSQEVMLMRQWG